MEKKMANFIWLIRAVQLFADCFKLFFIYIYYMATIVHML